MWRRILPTLLWLAAAGFSPSARSSRCGDTVHDGGGGEGAEGGPTASAFAAADTGRVVGESHFGRLFAPPWSD
jgi:hypothetical protein